MPEVVGLSACSRSFASMSLLAVASLPDVVR